MDITICLQLEDIPFSFMLNLQDVQIEIYGFSPERLIIQKNGS
jgi:anthranilate/para-aminobenzoate synthase component I